MSKLQPKSTGQLSGKYYRTRSLSQNLQQIFHPIRQSHSRSINNLSIIGAGQQHHTVMPISKTMGSFPQSPPQRPMLTPLSLPQSPRIHIDSPASAPLFPTYQFNPLSSIAYYPSNTFNMSKPIGSPTKLRGYQGSYRKKRYQRSISAEVPVADPMLRNTSQRQYEERRRSDKFMINDVLRENDELLRRFSESKEDDLSPTSLTLFQNAFKSKLGSLFKHKKKYKLNEISGSGGGKDSKESDQSSQSLPTLMSDEKRQQQKQKKDIRQLRKIEKLKSLNLNPPQMIGGSFDNLLMIDRVHKKKSAVGCYDTYHGRPLMSQMSRLKALYKYRKPSESDDATTLSFDYDSGEESDHSSIERSSSESDSSSFSDLTNKSSSRDYKMHSSVSIHSMPHYKKSRKGAGRPGALPSPLSSHQQFAYNYRNPPPQSQSMMTSFKQTSHIPHQISAPTILEQASSSQAAANQSQAIRTFFTSQPDDVPLVSVFKKSQFREQKKPKKEIQTNFRSHLLKLSDSFLTLNILSTSSSSNSLLI